MIAAAWIVPVSAAQLLDWATAVAMPPHKVELNPVGAVLLADPALAMLAKVLLIWLVLLSIALNERRNPRAAYFVALLACVFGILGAWSNL